MTVSHLILGTDPKPFSAPTSDQLRPWPIQVYTRCLRPLGG